MDSPDHSKETACGSLALFKPTNSGLTLSITVSFSISTILIPDGVETAMKNLLEQKATAKISSLTSKLKEQDGWVSLAFQMNNLPSLPPVAIKVWSGEVATALITPLWPFKSANNFSEPKSHNCLENYKVVLCIKDKWW